MRVIVLGAGLTGVTSAWYLAQAGHEVTVIDRQPGPCLETSFANGGQISVSHPEPWANPKAPGQILKWLGREDAPLRFHPHADLRQWRWGLQFLLQCLPGNTRRNTDAIAKLARYSQTKLHELLQTTGIEYERLSRGILHLFFNQREFADAEAKAALLRGYGMRAERVDARQAIALEPALGHCQDALAGALYAADDESGDAYQFTQKLAELCAARGVKFCYSTSVIALEAAQGRISGVQVKMSANTATAAAQGECARWQADAYVLALGSYSPLLVAPLGESLPIYPVKGYSVTLPVIDPAWAPQVSVTDESHRIVCSRLGNRLRIAGMAELDGFATELESARCAALLRRAMTLFPDAGDAAQAEFWAGLRPATPSNVPIIGASGYRNLFYNTGHGTLGWTLACGSAQAIADIISGRKTEVDFPFHS